MLLIINNCSKSLLGILNTFENHSSSDSLSSIPSVRTASDSNGYQKISTKVHLVSSVSFIVSCLNAIAARHHEPIHRVHFEGAWSFKRVKTHQRQCAQPHCDPVRTTPRLACVWPMRSRGEMHSRNLHRQALNLLDGDGPPPQNSTVEGFKVK